MVHATDNTRPYLIGLRRQLYTSMCNRPRRLRSSHMVGSRKYSSRVAACAEGMSGSQKAARGKVPAIDSIIRVAGE